MKEYSWKQLVICGQAMGSGYRIFENERVCLETLGRLYEQVNGFWSLSLKDERVHLVNNLINWFLVK